MAIHHYLLEQSKKYVQHFSQFLEQKKKERKHEFITEKPFSVHPCPEVMFEVSLASAIKIIFVLIALFVLWKFVTFTSSLLISLFFAAFLSATLYPSVRFLERHAIPRGLAILLVFIFLFSFLIFLFSTIVPALINQGISLGNWFLQNMKSIYMGDFSVLPIFAQQFGEPLQESLKNFDAYLQSLQTDTETQKGLFQTLTDNVDKIASWKDGITSVISAVMGFLGQMFLVFLMVFFIILDRETIRSFLLSFFGLPVQKYLYLKSYQVQEKISEWVHGQMILFLFMGTTTWLFLSFMGVEYALAIGFISGIAEFLPFVGPPLTLIIALPLAFGQGVDIGIYTIIFFACQQFVEGNILVPLVMEKAVGVSPLVTVLAMLIGFQFLGILGAIMAIPLASIIGLFLEDLRTKDIYSFEYAQKKNHSVP